MIKGNIGAIIYWLQIAVVPGCSGLVGTWTAGAGARGSRRDLCACRAPPVPRHVDTGATRGCAVRVGHASESLFTLRPSRTGVTPVASGSSGRVNPGAGQGGPMQAYHSYGKYSRHRRAPGGGGLEADSGAPVRCPASRGLRFSRTGGPGLRARWSHAGTTPRAGMPAGTSLRAADSWQWV